MSMYSLANFIIFLNMEIPALLLRTKEHHGNPPQKCFSLLRLGLLIWILTVIVIPVGMDYFSYSASELLAIWIISWPCATAAYWIVFALVLLRGKPGADALELVSGGFYLVSGAVLGEEPPAQCYWLLVIPAVLLILLSLYLLTSRRKHQNDPLHYNVTEKAVSIKKTGCI